MGTEATAEAKAGMPVNYAPTEKNKTLASILSQRYFIAIGPSPENFDFKTPHVWSDKA